MMWHIPDFAQVFFFHNVSNPKHDVCEQYICLFHIHLALKSIWFLFRLVISLSKMHHLGSYVWALAFLAWSNVFRHGLSLAWLLKVRLLYVHWVQGPRFRIRFEKSGTVDILSFFFFLFAHYHQSVFVYRYNSPLCYYCDNIFSLSCIYGDIKHPGYEDTSYMCMILRVWCCLWCCVMMYVD